MTDTLGCGEGYLVESADTAREVVSRYMKKGYRGVYFFRGSPHFFMTGIKSQNIDGMTLRAVAQKVATLLSEGRAIILLEGASFFEEDEEEALKFFCLIKDHALVSGSCFILYAKNMFDRQHAFLERELVRLL